MLVFESIQRITHRSEQTLLSKVSIKSAAWSLINVISGGKHLAMASCTGWEGVSKVSNNKCTIGSTYST